jgi:hypothetical protein
VYNPPSAALKGKKSKNNSISFHLKGEAYIV